MEKTVDYLRPDGRGFAGYLELSKSFITFKPKMNMTYFFGGSKTGFQINLKDVK